jgi:hypothetical protein
MRSIVFVILFLNTLNGYTQPEKKYYYWKFTYSISFDRTRIDTSIDNYVVVDSNGILLLKDDPDLPTKGIIGQYFTENGRSFLIPESYQEKKIPIYNLHDTVNSEYTGPSVIFPKGMAYRAGLDTMIDGQNYLKFVRFHKGQPGIGDTPFQTKEYIDPVSFMPKLVEVEYLNSKRVQMVRLYNYAVE